MGRINFILQKRWLEGLLAEASIRSVMAFNMSSSRFTVQSARVCASNVSDARFSVWVVSVCLWTRWRGGTSEKTRDRGEGGKPCAHGNLVPLQRKGGLGEVCFVLDFFKMIPVSSLALHRSLPPLSLFFCCRFLWELPSSLWGPEKERCRSSWSFVTHFILTEVVWASVGMRSFVRPHRERGVNMHEHENAAVWTVSKTHGLVRKFKLWMDLLMTFM